MSSADYTPTRIEDRCQISDTIYRWCRALDRKDYNAMRALFFPDATDNHGLFNGGVDDMIAWLQERHANITFCAHMVSNILIEFAGIDTAIVETYVASIQLFPAKSGEVAQVPGGGGPPGVPMHMLAYARYADRFERRNGEWRIARRTVIFDSQMVSQAPQNAGIMPPGFIMSRRDETDFIFDLRREAGLPI